MVSRMPERWLFLPGLLFIKLLWYTLVNKGAAEFAKKTVPLNFHVFVILYYKCSFNRNLPSYY